MSKRTDKSTELLNQGYNCAQSVIFPFADVLDFNHETAAALTSFYGSGMGDGLVCGAVSGAIAVLGFKHGGTPQDATEKKLKGYMDAKVFLDKFKERKGTHLCYGLLGSDAYYFSPEGTKYREENESYKVCIDAVRTAVEILEEMGI